MCDLKFSSEYLEVNENGKTPSFFLHIRRLTGGKLFFTAVTEINGEKNSFWKPASYTSVLSSCTGTKGIVFVFSLFWLRVAYCLVFYIVFCVLVQEDRTLTSPSFLLERDFAHRRRRRSRKI